LKKHTRYQGTFHDVEITEGSGNARRFGREAKFLSHYGARLATLLREENLTVASVDEGVYVNAVAYPKGVKESREISGIFSKRNLEMEEALDAIDWRPKSQS